MGKALDNLKGNTSSGGSTDNSAAVGTVYLGPSTSESYAYSPTGAKYKVAGTTDNVVNAFDAKQNFMKDADLRKKWAATLAKNGLKNDPLSAQKYWNDAVDGASAWYTGSGGQQKITPDQYVTWLAAAQGISKPALPSRQVYSYTEADRLKMINDVSQSLRGQDITEEDKNTDWYKNLRKSIDSMISQGSVTTTKKVKNPKTGQLENVTTTTPAFSQEAAATAAESAIRAADPTDVARKERVDFTGWLFNSLGGK